MVQTLWTIDNFWQRIKFEIGLLLSLLFFIGVLSHLAPQYLSSILSIVRQVTPEDKPTLEGLKQAEAVMHTWQVADLAAADYDGDEEE
jgi:hypothetical protein